MLVQIYQEQENHEQCHNLLRKIIYLDSNSLYGYWKLADFYQNRGDKKRAKKMSKTSLNILKTLPQEQRIPELDNLSVQELILKLSL